MDGDTGIPEIDLGGLIPDRTLIVDTIHTVMEGPCGDRGATEAPEKKIVANTTIIMNDRGAVLCIGRSHYGRPHDLKELQRLLSDMGAVTRWMKKRNLPEDQKMIVYGDPAYLGITKKYPGIEFRQFERDGRGRDSRQQGAIDGESGPAGAAARPEDAISRMREFKILDGPYEGTLEDLDREINVVAGLVNLEALQG